MAITSMDQLIAGLTGSRVDVPVNLQSVTPTSYFPVSMHAGSANPWGAVTYPTTATVPTAATAGYPVLPSPAAGQNLLLAAASFHCVTASMQVTVYDRLWMRFGFSGAVTTPQAVSGTATLPAHRAPANGEGVEIWLEGGATATGTTAATVTVTYTNSDGVSGRTTQVTPIYATLGFGRMLRLPLQHGDVGVSSAQSVTLSNSTGAIGNFGIVLLKRITPSVGFLGGGMAAGADFITTGLPVIESDACLQLVATVSTATGPILGLLTFISG